MVPAQKEKKKKQKEGKKREWKGKKELIEQN